MNERKEALRKIAKEGKLVDFAQDMVNEVAQIIINMNPEMAENEPQTVGQIAKSVVMTWISEVANS